MGDRLHWRVQGSTNSPTAIGSTGVGGEGLVGVGGGGGVGGRVY